MDRNRNVLITDFGFANQFSSALDDLMSTSCGSPCYAAPELVMNQGVYVGPAVDIWSCGVILFAMLCGYLPYDDDPANPDSYNINLLYKYILSTPLIFPDYISKEACDLLSLMLVPDPEKRCTMETIMAHPWLSAHRHLFVNINEDEEQEQMKRVLTKRGSSSLAIVPEKEDITEQDQVIPASTSTLDITQPENEQIQEQQPPQQQEQPPQQDVVMEDVSSTVASSTTTTTEPKKEELPTPEKESKPTSSKEPIQRAAKNKIRPKSTVSSSTEKVLHFLSGHSTTPKPRNTNEKRTRHMSLATASAATEESHSSILQAKFLSSIQRRNTNNTSPTPNSSASTPHKRHNRASNIPTATTPSTARPSSTGTRRKTLSLLVNSVTDNIAHRRQPTMTTTTTTTTSHRPADNQAHMVPSVSEHTISDKEKHRSAGKKFMDWFKKKPLSKCGTIITGTLSY